MSNQDGNNGILCTICQNNGFIRYNCTNDLIVNDLQHIVNSTDNIGELSLRMGEIENMLNNIRDHSGDNYARIDMLALFAFLIIQKSNEQPNINLNRHITLEMKQISDPDLDPLDCAVCLEKMSRLKSLTFDCNHYFCGECVINNLQHDKYIKPLQCYLCRHEIQTINIYDDKNIYDKLKEQINT